MKILIAGANGTTGMHILLKNYQKIHNLQCMAWSGKKNKLGHPILADLGGNVDKVVDNMKAIIFSAVPGPKTGPDKTTAVDKNRTIILIDAAKMKGIDRFVMISSDGSDNPQQAQEALRHYLEEKHDADEHLKASGMTYTIVR
ncbi:NAD(P)H-binding protein [Peribacillus butanolivorans]|uniref:NAD(P)H-binding protein n=1 Tax=Peribacillus butanolivorans TaxID=421767 RepID=UPI0035DCEB69